MPTKIIKLDSILPRIILVVSAILCLVFVLFATKWFLGNSISVRVFQQEVAQFAVSLAPDDPQTHYNSGVLYEQSFQPEDLPKSLVEYEKAVALSPNNYLMWLAYGKAKERNGDSEGAEQALIKALELAPNYVKIHWVYGNILLRQGKTSEAFAAIRKTVETDRGFASLATATALDVFEGDIRNVKIAIGDSVAIQSSLAVYLAEQKNFDESLEIWNELPEVERKITFIQDSEKILNQLIKSKKYRSALEFESQLDEENSKKSAVGKITNGGFEGIISKDKSQLFEWQIADGNQPKIGLNIEQKHGGEKSLALVFNSPVGKDFRSVSQTIAVEGGTSYSFEAFYKSNLETSATVSWKISDAVSGKVLAKTKSTEQSDEWKNLSANFRTSEDSEGVVINLMREKCTVADCSISGTIWFDDISLN